MPSVSSARSLFSRPPYSRPPYKGVTNPLIGESRPGYDPKTVAFQAQGGRDLLVRDLDAPVQLGQEPLELVGFEPVGFVRVEPAQGKPSFLTFRVFFLYRAGLYN